MGNSMDAPRLPGPDANRRYGRRAGDGAAPARYYQATFVAQVAGLSLPRDAADGAYRPDQPAAPTGLVADAKV